MDTNAAAAAAASAALTAAPPPPSSTSAAAPAPHAGYAPAGTPYTDAELAFGYHQEPVPPEPGYGHGQPPAHTQYAMDDDDPFALGKAKPPSPDDGGDEPKPYTADYAYHTHHYPPSPENGAADYSDEEDAFALEPAGPIVPSVFGYADGGVGLAEEAAKDGVYPPSLGRAIDPSRLNEAQLRVFNAFPKDLDQPPKRLRHQAKDLVHNWRSYIQWKYWHWYLIITIIIVLTILITVFHTQIIDWLKPVSKKMRELPAGWLIPVAILFIISFPPLFGHEIVGILVGVVWGLWEGFGILAFGTLLGEIGNYFAFKSVLSGHARKFERKSLDYACMAHIVREGGLWIILLARLSAIPGHFTTAVFATVGMGFWIFLVGCILSLPKQLEVVYLGVVMEQTNGGQTAASTAIKYIVLGLGLALTVGAMWYIYHKMALVRPHVQATMRDRRYRLLVKARTSDPLANPKAKMDEIDPEGAPPPRPQPESVGERLKHFFVGTRRQPHGAPATADQGAAGIRAHAFAPPPEAYPGHDVSTGAETPYAAPGPVVMYSPELQTAHLPHGTAGGPYDAPGARLTRPRTPQAAPHY